MLCNLHHLFYSVYSIGLDFQATRAALQTSSHYPLILFLITHFNSLFMYIMITPDYNNLNNGLPFSQVLSRWSQEMKPTLHHWNSLVDLWSCLNLLEYELPWMSAIQNPFFCLFNITESTWWTKLKQSYIVWGFQQTLTLYWPPIKSTGKFQKPKNYQ